MHKQTIALIDDDRNILTSISIALEKEVKNITTLIIEEMTSVIKSDLHTFSTPLTVDVNTGDNWGILH